MGDDWSQLNPRSNTRAARTPLMKASTLTCSAVWACASVASVAAAAVATPPRKIRRETSLPGLSEDSWPALAGLLIPLSSASDGRATRPGSESAPPNQVEHHPGEDHQTDARDDESAPVAQAEPLLLLCLGSPALG